MYQQRLVQLNLRLSEVVASRIVPAIVELLARRYTPIEQYAASTSMRKNFSFT